MEKWAFIINPVAGGGHGKKLAGKIEEEIQKYKPGSIVKLTEYPGHAGVLAEELKNQNITHLIAVGGDGTVNETAAVLAGTDIILGVIPAGTGNDFMQISGFPEKFTENDWEIFFSANYRPIDCGMCNGRYFFNGMGLGFDAEMTAAVTEDRQKTGRISKTRYSWFILKTLLFYREKNVNISVNGKNERCRSFMTTCSIGRRFAGGYFLTPKAIADDGLLDVLRIRPMNLFQRLSILLKVPEGTHLGNSRVDYFNAENLVLEFEEEVAAHLDGELLFSKRFEISILPARLNLLIHPGGRAYLKTSSKAEEAPSNAK